MTSAAVAANRRGPRVRTDMGYVCARLRARFARLLPPGTVEILRGLPSLAELFSALLPTDYGPSLKEWVLDINDLGEWETAFTATFARRVSQVRALIEDSVPAYAYLVDGEWDAHHLRALLRRITQGVEAGPRAETSAPSSSPSARLLAIGIAMPWLPARCRTSARGSSLGCPRGRTRCARSWNRRASRQSACGRSSCCWTRSIFAAWPTVPGGPAAGTMPPSSASYVALLADLTNLRTALRFLGRRLPGEQVPTLYLRGGTLAEATFAALMAADGVEQIRRLLSRGPLTAVLDQGRLALANTGRASVFERAGDGQMLQLVHRLARRCPVSVAVPLDYLTRSRNEWINLKMVACGIRYHLPAARVREGLVYV